MDSAAALQTVSNCEERNSVCNTPECVIAGNLKEGYTLLAYLPIDLL